MAQERKDAALKRHNAEQRCYRRSDPILPVKPARYDVRRMMPGSYRIAEMWPGGKTHTVIARSCDDAMTKFLNSDACLPF